MAGCSLNGGITSLDNSENMANFFQKIVYTLNPVDRITTDYAHFYFGLAATILALEECFLDIRSQEPDLSQL